MCDLLILDPIWVSAIAAFIAAIVAVLYVIYTRKIVEEMQKDREEVKINRILEFKPIIKGIILDNLSNFPKKLVFSLKNVGRGPALELKVTCSDELGNRWSLDKDILPIGGLECSNVDLLKGETVEEVYAKLGDIYTIYFEFKDIFENTYKSSDLVPRTKNDLLLAGKSGI